MRLRIEEKIRLGYISKTMERLCKDCGIVVGKGKSYCSSCLLERKKHQKIQGGQRRRKYTICGFEGCKKPRTKNKHSCEYHSKENRYKRNMEDLVHCKDCNGVIGKRKDNKYQWYCDGCKDLRNEIQRKRQLKYYKKWFKEKYNNDEEFRKKWNEYQLNYRKQKNNLNSN